MAMNEQDLYWLSQAANTPYYKSTYNFMLAHIKNALKQIEHNYPGFDSEKCDIYIQGSYRNGTMTTENSKLEIIVEFPLDAFGQVEIYPILKTKKILVDSKFVKQRVVNFKPALSLGFIKNDLYNYLFETTQNSGIFKNNKTITFPESRNFPIAVEVLPGYGLKNDITKAVIIWDSLINKYVASFPELHCENLQKKNEKTNGNFIKIVRAVRTLRDLMIQNDIINTGFAPSYFMECLLYNVPDVIYTGNKLSNIYLKLINYLRNCNLNNFVCAHEQFKMFGNNSDAWTTIKARSFIKLLIDIWSEYDE